MTRPATRVRRSRSAPDSRNRIIAAACAEFAARGFDGAKVDRIAARARVNKAMIYYHFHSKRALYRELLHGMLSEMVERIRPIAAADLSPFQKLDAFVEELVSAGLAKPHLPPIMLREIAEGGRHVEQETMAPMLGMLDVMTRIIAEGTARREFRQVDPLLIHLTTIWPVMVYLTSKPLRSKVTSFARVDASRLSTGGFVRHLQHMNRRAVAQDTPARRSPARRRSPESAS